MRQSRTLGSVGGGAQQCPRLPGHPFRQAAESSGRPMKPGVHSEPITFLSGRLPPLSAHRSTAWRNGYAPIDFMNGHAATDGVWARKG